MASSFLVPIKRSGNASPIFFVPSAGTTVLSLVKLARMLATSHPLYAFEFLELPVNGKRPATIEQMALLCLEQIRKVQESGPYFIGGHCWGGALAFEIAARIEATSSSSATLMLLESVPPTANEASNDGVTPRDSGETTKVVSELCDQVRDRLSRASPQLAQRVGPLTWELIDLALSYRATTRISAPVLLIRTRTHPRAVFQKWRQLTSCEFEEQVVPGDTFSMLDAPIVNLVCRRLEEVLRRFEF